MNKKSWIIIAIVILLLIGGGIFFYLRNSAPTPNESNYEAGKTSVNDTLKQRTETSKQSEDKENQENSEEQQSKKNQENSETSKDQQNEDQGQKDSDSENQNNSSDTNNETTQGITESENNASPTTEEQIATFSTKIYTKDSARQNNISITCNTLNGTIVKNGSSFSFCNTVGASSTSKGYQKADIFDKNGNKKKGLGRRKLSN